MILYVVGILDSEQVEVSSISYSTVHYPPPMSTQSLLGFVTVGL